jgi:hypothetical protein
MSGVVKYTAATVKIYFPEDKVCCDLCPLMETYSRKQCRRTGQYLLDTRATDPWCPLEIEVNGCGTESEYETI